MRKAGGVKVQAGEEGGRGSTGGARRGDLSTHGFTLSNVLHGLRKENKVDIYTGTYTGEVPVPLPIQFTLSFVQSALSKKIMVQF